MISKGAALFAIIFVAVLADEPKRELAWYNDFNHLKMNIQDVKQETMWGIRSAWRDINRRASDITPQVQSLRRRANNARQAISNGASMAKNKIDGGLGNLKNIDLARLGENVERSVTRATSDLSSGLSKINNKMSDAVGSVKDMDFSKLAEAKQRVDSRMAAAKNTLSDISRKASRSADDISRSAAQISSSVQGNISQASRWVSKMDSGTVSKPSKPTRLHVISKEIREQLSSAQSQTLKMLGGGAYPLEDLNKDLAYLNSDNWCSFELYNWTYNGECKKGSTDIMHGRGVRFQGQMKIMVESYFKDGKREGNGRFIFTNGSYKIEIYKDGRSKSAMYYDKDGNEDN